MLIMILCNYFPILHVIACACCLVFVPGWGWKLGTFLCCLYLVPVLCTRIALAVHPLRNVKVKTYTADHYVWWFTFCTQTLFLRFPFLEEALRTVPALYSLWLRLWGSKIGKLVYWTPGTFILDRPFLIIGDHAGLGLGTRLCSHIHVGDELWLAPIDIGANAVTGAYSLIGPGTVLKPGEKTKVGFISPPFSVWQGGKRISK